MKKNILCFFMAISLYAQDRKYVATPTVAYNDAKASKAIGIFLRGSEISDYEIVNSYIYKVPIRSLGYVYITDNYNIKDRLNVKDHVDSTPAIFVDYDEYYGSPHLFTTVAGLKVRENPDAQSKVLGTLLNGTVVPIYFYPYDENGWVTFMLNNKIGFIPRKYIGSRPDMDNLILSYRQATTPEDQQKYAERIVELGWNSFNAEKAKAFFLFSEYLNSIGSAEKSNLQYAQAKVIDAISKKEEYSNAPIGEYVNSNQFGFLLGGKIENANGFSGNYIEKYLGKITKTYVDLDDCALQDFEDNVFFKSAEMIYNTESKKYTVRSLDMIENTGFRIGQNVYNQDTTELDFLNQNVKNISWISQDGIYGIAYDGFAYEFSFKEGKLAKVILHFYC